MTDSLSSKVHSDSQIEDSQNLQQSDKPISDLIILEVRSHYSNTTELADAIGIPKCEQEEGLYDLFKELEDQNIERNNFIYQIKNSNEDAYVREFIHQFDTHYYNPYQDPRLHSSELDRQQTAQYLYWRAVHADLRNHDAYHGIYCGQIIRELPSMHYHWEKCLDNCIHRSLDLVTVEKYREILFELQEENSIQLQRNEEILLEFQEHIRNQRQYFRDISNKLKARTLSQAEEYKNIKAKLEDKTRVSVQQYCDIILKLQAHSRLHRDIIQNRKVRHVNRFNITMIVYLSLVCGITINF
ncbi:hypothetical protein CAAN1_17S02784 [[Candida] anglica]|uniref:Uncharacterized protein n=1 Tax=[Candida] anglica TaxID=148631 RepID=A0ABP0E7J7_9ASCO